MITSNITIISSITSFCILVSIGIGYLSYQNMIEYNNDYDYYKNKCEYEKMYKIIETIGELDKDPYKRTISPKVVFKFCKIAKSKSINLDTITDAQFDLIYKIYTNYLIQKYENNN